MVKISVHKTYSEFKIIGSGYISGSKITGSNGKLKNLRPLIPIAKQNEMNMFTSPF